MGTPRHNHANGYAVGVLSMSSLCFIGLISLVIYVYTTPGSITTMGITMRASIFKKKPTSRAIITTTATPKEWQSKQLAKSPRTGNINSLLAMINLPSNRFDNVLEALRPTTSPSTDNDLNDPCDLTPLTNKNMHEIQIALPMGVDKQEAGCHTPVNNASPLANEATNTQTTPPSRSMRIKETATLVVNTANLSGGEAQGHQSILLLTTNNNHSTTKPEAEEVSPRSEGRSSEIHDHDQMLYRLFSKDRMKEAAYHVTDFAGFNPVLPIVEFSMAPNGATKDERMTSFIKCVTALLGEMLYVDDTAIIAPIDIMDDNNARFIKAKADLQTNFTKLGKHIMISGGSWVFNEKDKGSDDVYGRVRLKSQIPIKDIINRVSFKFFLHGL
jgi:hypothetical protein